MIKKYLPVVPVIIFFLPNGCSASKTGDEFAGIVNDLLVPVKKTMKVLVIIFVPSQNLLC